jgi:predicted glycoside hydrolase/deacetylase ChbG (UPF0249 family)
MKKISTSVLFVLCSTLLFAQSKTLQERLGYPRDAKLVILHADDLGVSHSENAASMQLLEKGPVRSASIMVPCPWFGEIASYASTHPQADFGLHLTLTSEWKFLKWGSVIPSPQVASLLNDKGFFYSEVADLGKHGNGADVERELRGQIERAKQFGIAITHFDTHMGSVLANPDFVKTYIKLGREYHVPVLLTAEIVNGFGLKDFVTEKDVVLDRVAIASPADFAGGMQKFYSGVLRTLQPGVTYLILHAALDDDEMKAVTVDHPDYGAAWRQADFNFFSSDECKRLLAEQHITVITWREISEKLN